MKLMELLKNNPGIRLLTVLLLLAGLVSLPGCGGAPAEEPASAPEAPAGDAAPEAAETGAAGGLETRWKVEAVPGPTPDNNVNELVLAGDKLYAVSSSLEGSALYVSDRTGSVWQELALPQPETEEEAEQASVQFAGLSADESGVSLLAVSYTDQGQEQALHRWDADCAYIGSTALETPVELSDSSWVLLGDKLLLGGTLYSAQGEALGAVELPEGQMVASNVLRSGDRLYVFTCASSWEPGISLWELDSEGKLNACCELPELAVYDLHPCTGEAGLYLATGDGLFTLDPATGAQTLLLDWLEAGINPVWLDSVNVTAEGELYLSADGEIFHLSSYQGPARQVLDLAVGAGTEGTYLSQAISIFNQSSEDYVIQRRRIMPEEMEAFRTELTSGKGPDILSLGSTVDRESQFTRFGLDSGLCEDLMPYIDADPVYNRDCFVPGLLDSAMENGHLYQLDPGFQVYALAVPASRAEEARSWTVDSLLELRDTLPEGVTLFNCYSRSDLAQMVLNLASVEYVDYANASCSFDDPSFIRWLELWNSYSDDQLQNAESSAIMSASTTGSLPGYLQRTFGEDYVFMGWPGKEGQVQLIRGLSGFSIMASSQHKDGAWAFLRTLLDLRVQSGSILSFTLPVTQEGFDKWVAKLTETGTDTGFTREDADRILAAAAEAKGWVRGDVISDIITEEAEKAFSTGRPLKEAAAAIQSRAKIYLAEQYG